MSYTVPTTEPTKIYKNATLQWTKELSDYPASTWTLTYYFKHTTAANDFSIVASASGDTHSVTVAAASVTYTVGSYRWFGKVSDGSSTYYPDFLTGETDVLADPASASTARVLSHAQTMLAAIKSVLEGSANSDASSYTIGSRSISKIPPKELIEWEAYWQGQVDKEKRAEDIIKGKKPKDRILISLKSGG